MRTSVPIIIHCLNMKEKMKWGGVDMIKRWDGMSGLNCIQRGGALRHSGGGGAVGSRHSPV